MLSLSMAMKLRWRSLGFCRNLESFWTLAGMWIHIQLFWSISLIFYYKWAPGKSSRPTPSHLWGSMEEQYKIIWAVKFCGLDAPPDFLGALATPSVGSLFGNFEDERADERDEFGALTYGSPEGAGWCLVVCYLLQLETMKILAFSLI